MKHLYRLLVLLSVLCLGACSSPSATGHGAATPARRTPTATLALPTPSPIAINLTPLSLHEAWGDVPIGQFSLDMGDRFFAPISADSGATSITDDEQMCGSTIAMHSTTAGALTDISSLGLIDLHSGQITLLTTFPVGYHIMSCAVSGSWVIWLQVYGNTLEGFATHWLIKALNRETQELRTLDQSQVPTAQSRPASIIPRLTASHGRVVWTSYSDTTPGDTQSVMYTLATATKTVLASGTSGPVLSWPWVSWGDGHQRAIVFDNLETGQQVLLSLHSSPSSVAFTGTSFALADNTYSTVTLYPSITANPLMSYVVADKSVDNGGFNEFPTVNERLVSWISNSSLVFDRKLMRQVDIGNAPGADGFQGTVCSHFLVSQAALTAADKAAGAKGLPYHHVLRVIDTNPLP